MKKLLDRWERHTPELVRRGIIFGLLVGTEIGFRRGAGSLGGHVKILFLPSEEMLALYGDFSRKCVDYVYDCAATCQNDSTRKSIIRRYRRQVFRSSYRLGHLLRLVTGLRDQEDLQRLLFLLYNNIGITLEGSAPGRICVPECYFSKIYSARQCRFMSAMDWGIMAGLYGGGRLKFEKRLTEGCRCCEAYFNKFGGN